MPHYPIPAEGINYVCVFLLILIKVLQYYSTTLRQRDLHGTVAIERCHLYGGILNNGEKSKATFNFV